MATSFEHRVSRSLQCPVCLEQLTMPKQLSCTHTFCKNCLGNILASSFQNTAGNSLTCPICRSTTHVQGGNVLNLKTNVPLKSLIDDVRNSQQTCDMCDSNSKAVHFCCECGKYMCNTCLQDHNTWKPNLKHKVVSVEDIREGRVVLKKKVFCQEHKSDGQEHVCTDVCITCKKFICLRCMIYHKEKGHTVQDAGEYNASIKTKIESLQARSKTKTTTIKDHMTCIKTQKKRVSDHIAGRKAEINKIYEESIKKINERKAVLDKQLEAQRLILKKRLNEMKDADERLITSIESASVLAGNSLKAPLEGDIIVIRDSLSGELKNVLARDDSEKKLATDVADRAEKLIFTPNHQGDQLNIGEVRFMKCELECDVELSKKDSMNGMAATPDGRMAVGYVHGGIDIFSADGQLQQTVLKDVCITEIGFLSDGRYVINDRDGVALYTRECEKLDVKFEILSVDKGGTRNLTIDNNDLIYVCYRKAKKIQIFSPAGGKAIREILCDGYEPEQITSYNELFIIKYGNTMRIIDKEGNAKHKVEKSGIYPYAAVTRSNTILIAWVSRDDGLVSIDEYTNELKHIQTLISDHKSENPERQWYYLQEFQSGEIAFCTPDRLYIFKLTITTVSG